MKPQVGVDEVGRGSWAGPLLVVAARLKIVLPDGLKDSKQLTRKRREALAAVIQANCELGEGWVTPHEIDEHGLTNAMKLGVRRALEAIKVARNAEIIVDGHINYCPATYTNAQAVIKADEIHPIVSAASIYAKVKRDAFMQRQAEKFPDYGFERHVGYGTNQHFLALKKYGVSGLHRKSFKPIRLITEQTV